MYRFYMKQGDKQILLPVTPSKVTTKVGNNNKTSYILNHGEINLLRKIGLRELAFTVLLPHRQFSFVQTESGFQAPEYFLTAFREFKESCKPISLIIFRKLADGTLLFCDNMEFVMEDYTILEQGGEQGDFWVDIRLKEYRFAQSIIYDMKQTENGVIQITEMGKSRSDAQAVSGSTYQVKAGDTLWAIAKRYYGDGAKYSEVAKKNQISNPHVIQPGQILQM